ncbi:G5 domain-containing protein [Patescibacteria group bacterium]
MLHRILIFIMIIYSIFIFLGDIQGSVDVLGAHTSIDTEELENNLNDKDISYPKIPHKDQVETLTAFDQKYVTEEEDIPFEILYEDDEDLEYGLEEISTLGVLGKESKKYLVTHWLDQEIDRVLLSTDVISSQTEIVSKGTKISWKSIDTPDFGKIRYWHKMTVWATKYDSTCLGCNNTTALGAPVKQGVCAVDPKVIGMYTHFYVPGYGRCQALDVGGGIKGNKIDLAYEDVQAAPWRTGYVDIYLMDNAPN